MNQVVSAVLAGGKGTRLGVLTNERTKPSVSFGGKYRIIDWVLPNILKTGKITDTFIMQQYEPVSLYRHIGYGREWTFNEYERRIHLLWPQQTQEKDEIDEWPGTVSPIRQFRDRLFGRGHEAILVLAGDHIYEEDYSRVVETYNGKGADAAVYVHPVRRESVSSLGIMRVDEELRIVEFHEKPAEPELIEELKLSPDMKRDLGLESEEELWLGSMGVYLFAREVLDEYLDRVEIVDFGRDVIPAMIGRHEIYAHLYKRFWVDVGAAENYFQIHMEALEDPEIGQQIFHENLVTAQLRQNPGPRIYGTVRNSSISSGCVIGSRAVVKDSFLGYQVEIATAGDGDESRVRRCVLNGASPPEIGAGGKLVSSMLEIGCGVELDMVVADKNATIGDGVSIAPANGLSREERIERFGEVGLVESVDFDAYSSGLVVLAKETRIPKGFVA